MICKHEFPIQECYDCRPRRSEPQVWKAALESVCRHPSCHAVIDKGELIRWNAEATGVEHASHPQV